MLRLRPAGAGVAVLGFRGRLGLGSDFLRLSPAARSKVMEMLVVRSFCPYASTSMFSDAPSQVMSKVKSRHRTSLPAGFRSVLRRSKGTGEMNSISHSTYTVESRLPGGVSASHAAMWVPDLG